MIQRSVSALIVCIATCVLAQSFHWDAKKSHELAGESAIRFSKELSSADRTLLIQAIATKLRPKMDDLDIHSEKQLLSVVANTRIELVDLDGDGTPEVIAQSSGMETCGAVGNCLFWIFKKANVSYRSILNNEAQVFSVGETNTNGFRDVTLGLHDSATESHLFPYRFSNGRYRRQGCYDAEWVKGPGGPILKTPVITKCK